MSLLVVTAYLAWQARDEAIRASAKVDLQTQQLRAVAAQAAAQAEGNFIPGLATPLPPPSASSASASLPAPAPVPTAHITAPVSTASSVPPVQSSAPAGSASVPAVPSSPILTPLQKRVKEAPALGTVKEHVSDQGFVTLSAGAKNGVKEGMKFDLRRDASVVGRVTITIVEQEESIADVDPKSVPEGVKIQTGDEMISVVMVQ